MRHTPETIQQWEINHSNMSNNNSKYKTNEIKKSSHKRGLRVGCINVRGLVNSPTKRIDLNTWIQIHNLDVICIQEWYVLKKKDVNVNKNANNYVYNNNVNSFDDNDNDFDLAPLEITFNMAAFQNYNKIEHDNKTLILYKDTLEIILFDHFPKISNKDLDISWLGVKTNKKIAIIGSLYHNPRENKISNIHMANEIKFQKTE